MLQDTVLYTNMHMVLQLQPVIAANILQKDVRIRNTRHIIVRASINVSLLLILFSDKVIVIVIVIYISLLEHIYISDKACLDINKEFQCFYAEPNCPQREDERLDITKDNNEIICRNFLHLE